MGVVGLLRHVEMPGEFHNPLIEILQMIQCMFLDRNKKIVIWITWDHLHCNHMISVRSEDSCLFSRVKKEVITFNTSTHPTTYSRSRK